MTIPELNDSARQTWMSPLPHYKIMECDLDIRYTDSGRPEVAIYPPGDSKTMIYDLWSGNLYFGDRL